MEDYKKKYEEALDNFKKIKAANKDNKELVDFIEYKYPELKESEDERIRRAIIRYLKKTSPAIGENIEKMLAWLEKHAEQSNPYSGISFEYNGHIWGMCARDNGVDILLDKQLFTHLEKQGEQKHICQLDNSYAHVIFPFKAKVKSSDTIVTIHDGQLSSDGKEWIKYQSDIEDGYKIYEPNDLELVCEIEQKPTWSEDDEIWIDRACMLLDELNHLSTLTLAKIPHNLSDIINHLKSLKERYTWKPSEIR